MTTLLTIALIIGAALILMHLWTRRLTRMGAQSVPQPGQILPVNGGSIHYVEQGDPEKPTVVLIHGLGANLAFWYLGALRHLGRDHSFLLYDMRGHGASSKPIGSASTSRARASACTVTCRMNMPSLATTWVSC